MASFLLAGLECGGSTNVVEQAIAGEAITHGQAIYIGSDQMAYKVDVEDAAKTGCAGLALQDAASGAVLPYFGRGPATFTSTVAADQPLYCDGGANAGNLMLDTDIATSDYVVQVAWVNVANTTMQLQIWDIGVQHA